MDKISISDELLNLAEDMEVYCHDSHVERVESVSKS